jgi:hypothetical protein
MNTPNRDASSTTGAPGATSGNARSDTSGNPPARADRN